MITRDTTPASTSAPEDGRSREWQDRGRVTMPEDINPEARTSVERDFEPEQLPKPEKDDQVY